MHKVSAVLRYPGQRLMAFIMASLIMSSTANAQSGGLDAVVDRGSDLTKNITDFIQVAAMAAGVGAALWGVYQVTIGRKDRQQKQEGMMVPIMAIVGGTLMTSLIVTMGTFSSTIFGSNEVLVQSSSGF